MRFISLHIKPALKGEVDFAKQKPEGLKKERGFACYRQPLSQTFGLPAPRKGEPFGVVLCAKIYELTLRLEQGRLTHCRSQFSLFLPVLRFASSATGGAQLRTPAGEPFGAVYNSHIKPALKGEVDMSVSEWTEGL